MGGINDGEGQGRRARWQELGKEEEEEEERVRSQEIGGKEGGGDSCAGLNKAPCRAEDLRFARNDSPVVTTHPEHGGR